MDLDHVPGLCCLARVVVFEGSAGGADHSVDVQSLHPSWVPWFPHREAARFMSSHVLPMNTAAVYLTSKKGHCLNQWTRNTVPMCLSCTGESRFWSRCNIRTVNLQRLYLSHIQSGSKSLVYGPIPPKWMVGFRKNDRLIRIAIHFDLCLSTSQFSFIWIYLEV